MRRVLGFGYCGCSLFELSFFRLEWRNALSRKHKVKEKHGTKEKLVFLEQWYIDETLRGSAEKAAEIFAKSQEDLSVWPYERKGKEAKDGNSHWGALVCFWDWMPPTDGYWPEGRTCCYPHRLFLPITILFVCLHVSLFSGPSAYSLHPLHHPSMTSFPTSTDCLYLDCFRLDNVLFCV